MDVTKDTLLRKADALLAEARRTRKLAGTQTMTSDRDRLIQGAEELEGRAARLERDAASARSGVFAGLKGGTPVRPW
jgi:hypothetical protein